MALLATVYATVAGLVLAPGDLPGWSWPLPDELFGTPLACAGIAVLVVGIVALVGLNEGRALLIPAIVVGGILTAAGLAMQVVEFDPAVVLTMRDDDRGACSATSSRGWRWGPPSTRVDQIFSLADITSDPDEIDADRVGADAKVAHEILLAVAATVGVLLVLVAPFAVGLGVFGTILAIMCAWRSCCAPASTAPAPRCLPGWARASRGLVSVAVSMLFLHESWRPGAAIALAVVGAVLLVLTLAPVSPSVRRGRLGDVVESIALLSLLPLLVIAIGLFDKIRG